MPEKRVKLVLGYVPEVDYEDPDARRLGLHKRFAVLLEGYPRAQFARFFDADLFLGLLRQVMAHIDHDAASFDFEGDGTRRFSSLTALTLYYCSQPPAAREPLQRVQAWKDEKPVLLIEFESHLTIGKPAPYRGCYSFAAYTDQDLDWDSLEKGLQKTASDDMAAFERIDTGQTEPKVSLLKRVVDFIVYDANVKEK